MAYIRQRTGIDNINTQYLKDGRYWIGKSTWKDNRAGQDMEIETKRIEGILCSEINGQVFRNHGIPNANQQTVQKQHKQAVDYVTQRIIDGYEEGKEQLLQL